MLRQGAVPRENRFSSWRNETGLLHFFGNKTTQSFQASPIGRQTILRKFDWPACRQSPTRDFVSGYLNFTKFQEKNMNDSDKI